MGTQCTRIQQQAFDLDLENSAVRVPLPAALCKPRFQVGRRPGIVEGFITSLLRFNDLQVETWDPVLGY